MNVPPLIKESTTVNTISNVYQRLCNDIITSLLSEINSNNYCCITNESKVKAMIIK